MLIAAAATTATVAAPSKGRAQGRDSVGPATTQSSPTSKISFTVNGQARSLEQALAELYES